MSTAGPEDPARWRGRFHDGLTARAHDVDVRLAGDALEISGSDGATIARWPYPALVALERLRAGHPAQLARGPADDARLTLVAPCAFAPLVGRAPPLAGPSAGRIAGIAGRIVLLVAGVAALAAALWFGWPSLADGLAALIPASAEARIGAAASREMIAHSRLCTNPDSQAVLDRLVKRLTDAMTLDRPVTVTVVDLPVVNAFTLPGDRILVFRQLLVDAQSPEELAGILAHELGHVAGDHATRNLVRQFGLSLLVMALSGNSNWNGAAEMVLTAAYGREFEREADRRAIATLEAAGIGGQGWVDFFDRNAKGREGWDGAIRYFSNHPPSAERRDLATHLPPTRTPVMSAGDWLVLKSICAREAPSAAGGASPRERD